MSEDLCRKKVVQNDGLLNEVQKSSKKRLIISSRTRDKIRAGRSQFTTSKNDAEITLSSSAQNNGSEDFAYEDVSGISSVSRSKVIETVTTLEKIDDEQLSNKNEECQEERNPKNSSATRLREQIGYASSHNATRSHSHDDLILLDQESSDGQRNVLLTSDDQSNALLISKDIDKASSAISIHDTILIDDTTHEILNCSENKELNPKVSSFNELQDDSTFSNESSQLSSEMDKMSLSLNNLPTECEIARGEIRSQSGGRRRFKLPNINILGPRNAFSLVRTDVKVPTGRVEPELLINNTVVDELLVSTSMKLNGKKVTRKSFNTKNILNTAKRRGSRGGGENDGENGIRNPDVVDKEALEESKIIAIQESKNAWTSYLDMNSSVITDIFAGQLQSTIECLTCKNR